MNTFIQEKNRDNYYCPKITPLPPLSPTNSLPEEQEAVILSGTNREKFFEVLNGNNQPNESLLKAAKRYRETFR
ncbi:MAG: DUF1778 domain-containing protein [Phycisphaerales bacterium]|nr:DUF1778 domain-containing protein [Phycisphaerales bacterium]